MVQKIAVDQRNQWIAVAAYYLAEKRGFTPGYEVDDWLTAEQEYREQLIYQYILQTKEDGDMSLGELQVLAYSLGLEHLRKAKDKVKIVREIQILTEKLPCFQPGESGLCTNPELECHWRAECQRLVARWCW